MTQPESRTVDRVLALARDKVIERLQTGGGSVVGRAEDVDQLIAAAKEHGLVIGEAPKSYWMEFLEWEEQAAKAGSGMTAEQKQGAGVFRSWLVNHGPDDNRPERVVIGEGELDAAWKEAEAVLPDGWAIYLRPSVTGAEWHAQGRTRGLWMMANGPLPEENAEGPTPAAALHALAERLRR